MESSPESVTQYWIQISSQIENMRGHLLADNNPGRKMQIKLEEISRIIREQIQDLIPRSKSRKQGPY